MIRKRSQFQAFLTLAISASVAHAQPGQQTPAVTAPTVSLQGIAVMQSSGQPLSKAYIDLRGPASYSTTTEEDGKFYFPNVQPGKYYLYGRREGMALAIYGERWSGGPGQVITLIAGQPALNVQIALIPTAAITGHITDLNGNPVVDKSLNAFGRELRWKDQQDRNNQAHRLGRVLLRDG